MCVSVRIWTLHISVTQHISVNNQFVSEELLHIEAVGLFPHIYKAAGFYDHKKIFDVDMLLTLRRSVQLKLILPECFYCLLILKKSKNTEKIR